MKSDGFPIDWVKQVVLRDGLRVTIRPIRPADAEELRNGFKRLSPHSIYMRFLSPLHDLSENQARLFALVDYHSSMAFVATVDLDGETIIGVARYNKVGVQDLGAAECAVVVDDEYQGKGLGLVLLDQLVSYAREHGVIYFLATVHSINSRILTFIRRSGFSFEQKRIDPAVWEIRLKIN